MINFLMWYFYGRKCIALDLDGTARAIAGAAMPKCPPKALGHELRLLQKADFALAIVTGASGESALATEHDLGIRFDIVAHSYCVKAEVRAGRECSHLTLADREEVRALKSALPLLEDICRQYHGIICDRDCFTAFFTCPVCFKAAAWAVEVLISMFPELRFTANPIDGGISVMPRCASKDLFVRLYRETLGGIISTAAGDTKSDRVLLEAAEDLAVVTRSHRDATYDSSLLLSAADNWQFARRHHAWGLADILRHHRHLHGLLAV